MCSVQLTGNHMGSSLVTLMDCVHMRGQLFEVWEGFTEEEIIETGARVAQGGAMACAQAQKPKRSLRETEGNSGWLKCRRGRWGLEQTSEVSKGQIMQGCEGLRRSLLY